MTLLLLCFEFFKTGLFAIGGGLATVPFLIQMSQAHPEWFSLDTLADMIAISEATPGPVGINMATYTGYTVAGIPGALLATFSLILPAFLVILIISPVYEKIKQNEYVKKVFIVLRAVVSGLIAAAAFTIIKAALMATGLEGVFALESLDWRHVLIFAIFTVLMFLPKLKKLQPMWFILAGAAVGVIFQL